MSEKSYIVAKKYRGASPDMNVDADVINISTEPAMNTIGRTVILGSVYASGEFRVYALGAYDSLEEAEKKVQELFPERREVEDISQYDTYEGVVAQYKPGLYELLCKEAVANYIYADAPAPDQVDTEDKRKALATDIISDMKDEGCEPYCDDYVPEILGKIYNDFLEENEA